MSTYVGTLEELIRKIVSEQVSSELGSLKDRIVYIENKLSGYREPPEESEQDSSAHCCGSLLDYTYDTEKQIARMKDSICETILNNDQDMGIGRVGTPNLDHVSSLELECKDTELDTAGFVGHISFNKSGSELKGEKGYYEKSNYSVEMMITNSGKSPAYISGTPGSHPQVGSGTTIAKIDIDSTRIIGPLDPKLRLYVIFDGEDGKVDVSIRKSRIGD